MDEATFWAIIERGGPYTLDDQDRHLESVLAGVAELSLDDLREFHRLLDARRAEAYRWDVWGAAYLINGGCSDDGFEYFRGWLIAQGRAVFAASVANPDSLADVVDPEDGDCYEFALLGYVAKQAAEDRGVELGRLPVTESDADMGEDWDFDDDEEVRRRLPRLAAMYLTDAEPPRP